MAKRRNKNKAKRALGGFSRKQDLHGQSENISDKMEKLDQVDEIIEHKSDDLQVKVQVTENELVQSSVAETESGAPKLTELSQNKRNGVKSKKSEVSKTIKKSLSDSDGHTEDEVLIFPIERDGETCIDVQCGANQAYMYLDKLCVGSRGACVKFSDKWLTPNEFQLVSGRETAKDWKRSIRHKGRSLKLLISKGLITVQTISPKKSSSAGSKHVSKAVNKVIENMSGAVSGNPEPRGVTTKDLAEQHTLDSQKRKCRKPKKPRSRCPPDTTKGDEEVKPGLDQQVELDENLYLKTDSRDDSSVNNTQKDIPLDTKTDEERRFEEFCKTLKLTKTTAPATPTIMAIPITTPMITPPEVISDISEMKQRSESAISNDDVDPEMPVLQKEADVTNDLDNKQLDISVPVDPLQTTVTPPPTPPSERIEIEPKLITDEQSETFKATLASPSVGLKLTINREKVRVDQDNEQIKCEDDNLRDNKSEKANTMCTMKGEEKNNIQSMLLQDALQSAKKYKQQLQQNRHPSPCKIIQPQSVPLLNSDNPKSKVETTKKEVLDKEPSVKKVAKAHKVDKVTDKLDLGHVLNEGYYPSTEDIGRLSLPDFMSTMASAYGVMPSSVDPNELTQINGIKQQYDMLRMMLTQSQLAGQTASSAFLYQQMLLTMAQLYNPYNIPAFMVPDLGSPVGNKDINSPISSVKQMISKTSDNKKTHASNYNNVGQTFTKTVQTKNTETSYNKKISTNGMQLWRPGIPDPGDSTSDNNKRKHIEVDADGALDLSMKKVKHSNINPPPYTSVKQFSGNPSQSDSPLDFSTKGNTHSAQQNANIYSSQNGFNSSVYKPQTDNKPVSKHPGKSNLTKSDESCRCTCNRDIWSWSVEEVCSFLKSIDGCGAYTKTFHEQGISGRLLPYLTVQHLTRTLGMNLGPSLSLLQAVEHKCKEKLQPNPILPCMKCTPKRPMKIPTPLFT